MPVELFTPTSTELYHGTRRVEVVEHLGAELYPVVRSSESWIELAGGTVRHVSAMFRVSVETMQAMVSGQSNIPPPPLPGWLVDNVFGVYLHGHLVVVVRELDTTNFHGEGFVSHVIDTQFHFRSNGPPRCYPRHIRITEIIAMEEQAREGIEAVSVFHDWALDKEWNSRAAELAREIEEGRT